MATYGMSDSKLWKLGTYIVYVSEAKSRGLECGVKKLLQGDIRDLKSSEVKLYLTHLGIFDDELSDDVNEELYSAIQKLMTLEGFAYDDPRSPEAFTFVAETYAQRIDEDARKKYKCDAIRTKKAT